MLVFKPKRKYYKGAGRLRVEAFVAFIFWLVILGGSPVIVWMALSSTKVSQKIWEQLEEPTFGKGGMFVYLDTHHVQFAAFIVLGAAVLTGIYLIYQASQRRLYSLTFEGNTVIIELVNPYRSDSLVIIESFDRLSFNVNDEIVGEVKGKTYYKKIVTFTLTDKDYEVQAGSGPWDKADTGTIDELVDHLRSPSNN